MDPVRIKPCRVDAITRLKGISQAIRAIIAVTINVSGITRRAGQLHPTSSATANMSGENARNESKE
jgi:hypothetical protein